MAVQEFSYCDLTMIFCDMCGFHFIPFRVFGVQGHLIMGVPK